MWRSRRGVTFVEIILVMVIMGILGAIIAGPVIIGAKAWSDMSRQTEITQQARIGLDRFVRELRSIQRVNGRPSIKEVASNRIRFVTATGDDLTYCWNDTVNCDTDPTHSTWLVRKVWLNETTMKDQDVAAVGVQNFALTRYEDSNASIAQMRQEAEIAPVTCGGATCSSVVDVNGSNGHVIDLDATQTSLRYIFTGTGVVLVGPQGNNLGMANVQVDAETPVKIDQYSSTIVPKQKQPLFVWPPHPYGSHTITITFLNQKNAGSTGTGVVVDALDLLVSRVMVNLTVGEGVCTTPPNLCTTLRDQIAFRSVH